MQHKWREGPQAGPNRETHQYICIYCNLTTSSMLMEPSAGEYGECDGIICPFNTLQAEIGGARKIHYTPCVREHCGFFKQCAGKGETNGQT